MANEYHADPLAPVAHVQDMVREQDLHGHTRPTFAPPPLPYPPFEPPATVRSVGDVASILGLPELAVTPAVLASVTGLLTEFDRLRWHDTVHRHRLQSLEHLIDHHPVVPAFNRRGFMRILDLLLTTGPAEGTLVVLHVDGLEVLWRTDGLAAGEAALRHVCATLSDGLRTTDPLGLLSGGLFALVLVSTDLAAARIKTRAMMERVNHPPFAWQGVPHSFALVSGYHRLMAGETAESAVADADWARRGRGHPSGERQKA